MPPRVTIAQLQRRTAALRTELSKLPPARTPTERMREALDAVYSQTASFTQVQKVTSKYPDYLRLVRASFDQCAWFAACYFGQPYPPNTYIEHDGGVLNLIHVAGGFPPDRELHHDVASELDYHFWMVGQGYEAWAESQAGFAIGYGLPDRQRDARRRSAWATMVGQAVVLGDKQAQQYRNTVWMQGERDWVLRPEVLDQGRSMHDQWEEHYVCRHGT